MVDTPYAELFLHQACSLQNRLYDTWYYKALVERNRQWQQRKVRHDIVYCLLIFEPSKYYLK